MERIHRRIYKIHLNDPDNHNGVVTQADPEILECKVKGALVLVFTSGCDGILAELFKILKDDAIEVLHPICPKIWKTQQWPQDWKRSILIPTP